MIIICAATLFAASWSQTIVLMSVVEEVYPSFSLEVSHVENGYGYNTSKNEAAILSHNVKENVKASFSIWQSLSRYVGDVKITVFVTELSWNGYHTEGLQISGSTYPTKNRQGSVSVSNKSIEFNLFYSGAIDESIAAEFTVEYNKDSILPDETYVSYVKMVVEVK